MINVLVIVFILKGMKKICLLLLAVFLFSANIFAGDIIAVPGKNGTGLPDATGPVITYTLLTQSSCVTTRTFTANITDIDGVNTTPGTRPRVYYKRAGDVNNYFDNTSGTGGWKYAEASNSSSPFSFTIDYALLSGGVVSGQTIQYFVVAQDLNGTPNISINSGTFASPPSSVALTGAAFPIGGGISIYSIVNALPASITIGSFGDFSNLTAVGGLFNVINNVGLSGNTTVEIIDPLVTENNAIPLYQVVNTGCGSGTVSLLIKPAAGISPVITGSRPNEPIIRILSSNVTVDGSNNGTASRDMTLTNTSTTGPNVILFGSLSTIPTTNSTLKNTICINTMNLTSCIVVSDGSVGGSPGYFNNITIQNNSIQKSQIGIICVAAATPGNGSVLITGNDLNSVTPNYIGLLGIYTEGVDGAVISNNNIGNFEIFTTAPRYGIHLNTNTINSTVSGNTISGISYFTSSSVVLTCGIFVAPGVAASGNVITTNTISNISSAALAGAYGITFAPTGSPSGGVTIRNNRISDIRNANSSGYGAFGIGLSTTLTNANITVDNNFIYRISGVGGSSTLNRSGHGIYISSGGGYKIYYNSINLNANQTNALGVPSAIMINGVTTASSLDIRNNIFANTQTGGATARYSIYSANTNAIFSNIDNNDYYSTGPNLGFIGGTRATLTDIQTGFGSNNNSVNILPAFVSSTDLHVTTANCNLDDRGTPVSVTTDIDGATRDAEMPDIGADEFTSVNSGILAGIIGAGVCDSRNVSTGGTLYRSVVCDIIARVLPAGASPVTGKINTCVTLNATQQYFNGEPYVQRHYDIEPAVNAATATATVTLYFTDAEFANYNAINGATWPMLPTSALGNADPRRGNVRVTQFHGVATSSPSAPGNYPGFRVIINPGAANVYWNGTYWEVTIPVTGFSGFYLHTTQFNTPLPVSINYLNGHKQGNDHLLDWKVTCNTSPRVTMVLERSADSRNFGPINTVAADAARCNQPFNYTDADPLQGMNYYRLKVTDADGKISYSSIVALLNAVKGFDIISIAPNPVVADHFNLNVASAQAGKMEMAIFDMQGRLVSRQTLSLAAGFNSLPVNVGNLAAGSYTIRGNIADERSKIMRFVKQ